MNKQEYYRDKYRSIKPDWEEGLRLYINIVKKNSTTDSKILDIGCGHGDYMEPVYKDSKDTYGIDPDEEGLKKNKLIQNKIVGLAEDLPFEDNFFDIVVTAFVLEHIENPEDVFSEIYRVLKPGGKFIFLTPNSLNMVTILIRLIPNFLHDVLNRKLFKRQENDTFPVQYKINTTKTIGSLAQKLGFSKTEFILNGDPTYISFNDLLFTVSRLIESITPKQFKVHILGTLTK